MESVSICTSFSVQKPDLITMCSLVRTDFGLLFFFFDFCFTALQHILGHFGRGIVIIITLFQEDNIFGTDASLT